MIPSIGKPKILYKDHKEVKFESLEFYVTLAKKIIAKMGGRLNSGMSKSMLKNEDAISFVANAIMMGDWRWKENTDINKQTQYKSLYSYRNQCGIWAIKTYITKSYKNKNKDYSLNHCSIDDGGELESIIQDHSQAEPVDILISNEDRDTKSYLIKEILTSELLSEKQKEYIKLYFFENLTLEKIGKKFGVTREAVRQSIKVSIKKIKNLI